MSYCCFCIPLTAYAKILGYLQIIAIVCNLILLAPKMPLSLMLADSLYSLSFLIAADFMVIGAKQRNPGYIFLYLAVTVNTVLIVFIAICICASQYPTIAALLLIFLSLTCLLTFPIYLLYVEIKNENSIESTV